MIAGTHSSVGKTTWFLALMSLAQQNKFCVQPFKVGPDYIDPTFHHQISHSRKSRNLDLFLLSQGQVQTSFQRNTQEVDFALVEGMMGLFDGKASTTAEGSSAEVAKILGLPVFLVIDGSGLATSAAALVLGFQTFDPELNLAGVLMNRINSETHYQWLRHAIEARTGVPCLGYLPSEASLRIPERHLGLTTAAESEGTFEKIQRACELLKSHFDWNRFLEISKSSRPAAKVRVENSSSGNGGGPRRQSPPPRCRIGIAYDVAFSFYYEDNFDCLKEAGAEILFFSPVEDKGLPEGLDLLYFGGGFPEIYAAKLAQNQSMIAAVRQFYRQGGFIYAECGGFIYLTEGFHSEKETYPLAGLIPGRIEMTHRLQHFGYHELEAVSDTFLFPSGKRLRSHEFHYSIWHPEGSFRAAYRIGDRTEGFVAGRLLASYQHLHFGSDPEIAKAMIERREKAKTMASPSRS